MPRLGGHPHWKLTFSDLFLYVVKILHCEYKVL